MKRKKTIFELIVNQLIKLMFTVLLIFTGIVFALTFDFNFNISVTRKMEFNKKVSLVENIGKLAKGAYKGYKTIKKF